ncbi:MAG: HAD family hydrolase [Alphaproteobacteria bacterium]
MITHTPKAILFDWDNTLVNSWTTIAHCLNHVFEAYGMEAWSLETVKQRSRKSLRDNFPILFGDAWEDAKEIYYGEYRKIHLERLTPLPNAEILLNHLTDLNIPLGIVSNKMDENLQKELRALRWDGYFKMAYGSGSSPHDKPHPASGIKAVAEFGLMPNHDILYVGDVHLDVQFAHNLGVRSVLIGDAAEQGSPPIAAHHYFETLTQFHKFIE